MLHTQYKAAFTKALQPIALGMARLGLTPNALTLIGLAGVVATCAWLMVSRDLLTFCWLIVFWNLFDVIDGVLARATGTVTKFGAYLDAMCDRFEELAGVLAVAYVTGYWLLSMLVVAGSIIVSYAKARAAIEVPISNTEWPDLMERGERNVFFVVGLAVSRLVPWTPLGRDLFWWTLLVLAILTYLTAVQRILRARRIILSRS